MKRIHPLQLWHSMIRYKKPNQIKDQLQLTLLYLFKVAKLGSELAALRSERVDSVMEGKSNVLPILVKILMDSSPPPKTTIAVALLEQEKREMEETFMKELKDLQDQTSSVYDKEIERLKRLEKQQKAEIDRLAGQVASLQKEASAVPKQARHQSLQRVASRTESFFFPPPQT